MAAPDRGTAIFFSFFTENALSTIRRQPFNLFTTGWIIIDAYFQIVIISTGKVKVLNSERHIDQLSRSNQLISIEHIEEIIVSSLHIECNQ